MFRIACLFAGLMLAAPAVSTARSFDYPNARQGTVVDDYFGTRVADPYRWLEDVDSPQTRAWIEAENAISKPLLAKLPERPAFEKRMTELWNYERSGTPFTRAGKRFYLRNDGLQNQSVLYVESPIGATPRVLLDPNTLSTDGTVALAGTVVSPDGRWLAYGLQRSGSDWVEFRFRDIASGEDRADTLKRMKFSEVSWTHDSAGVFYSRYPAPPAGADPGTFDDLANQKLYYHALGEDQARDRLIYERPEQPRLGFAGEVTADGRWLVVSVWEGTSQNLLYAKDLKTPDAPVFDGPLIRLVDEFRADFLLIGSQDSRLFVLSNDGAERKRVIAFEPLKNATAEVVIPEGSDTIDTVTRAGDELIVLAMHDATHRLRRHGLDGEALGEIGLPGLGSVTEVKGEAGQSTLYYGFESFLQPTTQYAYDLDRGEGSVFFAPQLAYEPDDYVTEQVFYRSADGTRVPMFISHRKGLSREQTHRTYLYAYGGFDLAQTPSFQVERLVWMERGGVFALANLRGGGEYGEAWHRAGTLQNKQNVFDDFIAAGRYLVAQRWTTPRQLGINGRSNGGLLIGACVNQAPGLFAAAVPTVGVMDMLRFQKFTIGWAWVSDYGSSDDAEMFPSLRAISPVHNVNPDADYPAVLVTTGDHDDRVVPGHSFKYTAAMQAAVRGDARPVIIRVDTKAGHGGGKPVTKKIEESADIYAFLWHYTGL